MTEENKTFRYDAFISYRHCDPDKFVAKHLHKMLETYKLPAGLKKTAPRQKISRVFRDQEELPLASNLEDPIIEALSQSEWLIVICSPRLKESMWCTREIETFIAMHGRRKVLLVLAEGEPEESFPEQLLYDEQVVTTEDGREQTVRVPMEPLAADFRGGSHGEIKKKMKTESLRLLAPIFGVGFDDLRQRHRERRIRTIMTAALSVTVLAVLFGAYCAATAIRINEQKNRIASQAEEIREQNEEILKQNEEIASQAEEIETQYEALKLETALGLAEKSREYLNEDNRVLAIRTAVSALTEYEGTEMPYTPEAMAALADATYAYKATGMQLLPVFNIPMTGTIGSVETSPDGSKAFIQDKFGNTAVYDSEVGQVVYRYTATSGESVSSYYGKYGFVDNERIYFAASDGYPHVYNLTTGEESIVMEDPFTHMFSFDEGTYISLYTGFDYYILDGENFEILYKEDTGWDYSITNKVYYSAEEGCLYYCASKALSLESTLVLKALDVHDMSLKWEAVLDGYTTGGLVLDDAAEHLYVSVSNMDMTLFTSYNTVYCLNPDTGKIDWQKRNQGQTAGELYYVSDTLVVFSGIGSAFLVDPLTGETNLNCTFTSDILETFRSGDVIFVYTDNGSYGAILPGSLNYFENFNSLTDNKLEILEYGVQRGFYGVVQSTNAVVFYGRCANDDLEPYEGTYETYEVESLYASDLKQLMTTYDPERYYLAQSGFYTPDGRYLAVGYEDGGVSIYDVENGTLYGQCESYTIYLSSYLGTDAYGNMYVGNTSAALGFDSEGNYFGVVYDLLGISEDGTHLIVEYFWDDERPYACPVYDLQGLMEKADELMLKYEM